MDMLSINKTCANNKHILKLTSFLFSASRVENILICIFEQTAFVNHFDIFIYLQYDNYYVTLTIHETICKLTSII